MKYIHIYEVYINKNGFETYLTWECEDYRTKNALEGLYVVSIEIILYGYPWF